MLKDILPSPDEMQRMKNGPKFSNCQIPCLVQQCLAFPALQAAYQNHHMSEKHETFIL